MEAIIAIISAVVGLFLYNSLMRAKVLKNNDKTVQKDQELEKDIESTESEINKEKAKQEYIKEKNKQETQHDVPTEILTDFFNDRNKPQ